MTEPLSSAGAGWLVSTAADLGIRTIRGPEEERAVLRLTKEVLTGTLENYREIDDEEAWASFLEEFFADPLVCALLLRACSGRRGLTWARCGSA